MALLSNTAEGGSNGTGATTGNTGTTSGNAFDQQDLSNAGTVNFASAAAFKGALGYDFNVSSSTGNELWLAWNPTAARSGVWRFYFNVQTLPSNNGARIFALTNGSFSSNYLGINLMSSGVLRVIDAAGAVQATSSGSISTNTWYRCEGRADNSGGSAAGTSDVYIYPGDSGTSDSTLSLTGLTGKNFGGGNIGYALIGKWSGAANGSAGTATSLRMWMDDFGYQDSTSTLLGPSTSPGGLAFAHNVIQGI